MVQILKVREVLFTTMREEDNGQRRAVMIRGPCQKKSRAAKLQIPRVVG
jgi:hypothetical protein